MKKLAYIFIILVGFIACSKPYAKKPKDLLGKSEMTAILVDIYTSQQMLNANINQANENQVLNIAKNTLYIFEQHETTHQIFEESFKYYYTQPEMYQRILDDVKSELVDQLSETERKVYDNIQKQAEASQR